MDGKRTGIRRNLLDPLKDKQRTMKLNYLISNNYIIAGIVLALDVALFFAGNYMVNVLQGIPGYLVNHKEGQELYLGIKNVFPKEITITGAAVTLFLVLVIDAAFIYKIKVSFSELDFNVGQKGTQRFADTKEIMEQYKAIEKVDKPYEGMPGIVICRIGDKLYIDNTVVNNLILGITRSGKGEMFAKSSLETYSRASVQPSVAVNDPKMEHYKVFKPILEERGYKVFLLNCSNPALSMGFNPVYLVVEFWRKKDYDTAEMIANSFAYAYFNVDKATGEMRYFVSAASDLCVAMILATVSDACKLDEIYNQERYEVWKIEERTEPFQYKRKYETAVNLYSMVVTFGQLVEQPADNVGHKTMLDVFFEKRPRNDRAHLKFISTKVAPGKTKSSVFSEMLREMNGFTLHNVAKMTAENSLDFKELGWGEKPIAVFMATPSYDKSLYKIPTTYIRQAYYVLGKACDDHTGKCPRPVKFIIDETGNSPPIELIENIVTMGLGQNISCDFYFHNLEQITAVYGEEIAETIKGNCGNHIFIQTKSEKTAKKFSEILGTKSAIDVQRAGGKLSLNKYYTESIQERPLLMPNELLTLREGECVIHRTMKRRDLSGRKIRPYPIFNSLENGHYLEYAYEYFPEKFKHPNTVNLLDICTESREHIDPDSKQRLWNPEWTFKLWKEKQISVQYLRNLESGRYEEIDQILRKIFGRNYHTEYGITKDTSIGAFLSWINEREELSEMEKQMLLAITKEGM